MPTPGGPDDIEIGVDADIPEGLPLQERVVYLEVQNDLLKQHKKDMAEQIESLTEEVEKQKQIIRNLNMRYDAGQLDSAGDENDLDNVVAHLSGDNPSFVQELLRKTEMIAQKTMLENFDLREQLANLRLENDDLKTTIQYNAPNQQSTARVKATEEIVADSHRRKRSMSVGDIKWAAFEPDPNKPPSAKAKEVGVFGGLYGTTDDIATMGSKGHNNNVSFGGIQDLFNDDMGGTDKGQHKSQVSYGGIGDLFNVDPGALSDPEASSGKRKKAPRKQRDPSLGGIEDFDASWRTAEVKLGQRHPDQVSYGGVDQLFSEVAPTDEDFGTGQDPAQGVAQMFEEDPQAEALGANKIEKIGRHTKEVSYGGVKELFADDSMREPEPASPQYRGPSTEGLEEQLRMAEDRIGSLEVDLEAATQSKFEMIQRCGLEFERLRSIIRDLKQDTAGYTYRFVI